MKRMQFKLKSRANVDTIHVKFTVYFRRFIEYYLYNLNLRFEIPCLLYLDDIVH